MHNLGTPPPLIIQKNNKTALNLRERQVKQVRRVARLLRSHALIGRVLRALVRRAKGLPYEGEDLEALLLLSVAEAEPEPTAGTYGFLPRD